MIHYKSQNEDFINGRPRNSFSNDRERLNHPELEEQERRTVVRRDESITWRIDYERRPEKLDR